MIRTGRERSITLPTFKDDSWSELAQSEKILEEAQEVCRAVQENEGYAETLLEVLDVIQAAYNMLFIMEPTQGDMDAAMARLLAKHRKRGYITARAERGSRRANETLAGHCADCAYFERDVPSCFGICAKVTGELAQMETGYCNYWKERR